MIKWVILFLVLLAIPSYAADCCNDKLENSCEGNILHKGKCTGNEAFLLEYDPILKRYAPVKSFEDGNEAFNIAYVKMLIRTPSNITLVSVNNERLTFDLGSKQMYFAERPVNDSSFLTRYGLRGYPAGKVEIPKKIYEGTIDIYAGSNKTTITLNPGTKADLTLTHSEIDTLKDTIFKHNNQSYNAREILSLKSLYLDSGSLYASSPEPFVEAETMTYLLSFTDLFDSSGLNSSSAFNIKFLGKDASIYEIDAPHKVLLSLDNKINFRNDFDTYDNYWHWIFTSVPRLFLGLEAKNIRQGSTSCIETPFGYIRVCPRKINKSESVLLEFSKINATSPNNLIATILQINSSELLSVTPAKQTTKIFIADTFAYRTLVTYTRPAAPVIIEQNVSIPEETPNVSEEPKAEQPAEGKLKIKFGLYILFAILITLLVFVGIKSYRNGGKYEPQEQ